MATIDRRLANLETATERHSGSAAEHCQRLRELSDDELARLHGEMLGEPDPAFLERLKKMTDRELMQLHHETLSTPLKG